jgi:endoglucanase Acf2
MNCAHLQLSSKTLFSFLCSTLCLVSMLALPVQAQTVHVGAGSYTTALPAGDAAPSSTIFNSVAGPKPTHRFWAAKNWYADNIVNGAVTFGGGGGGPFNMFPQPLGMQTTASGLLMGFDAAINNGGTFFNQPFEGDLTIGVAGLNAGSVPVSGYTDWTVDFNFGPMTARVGRGMPFVYVFTNGSNPTVTFAGQPTVFANNGNILGVSIANNNYGLFCPSGGSWSGIGGTVLTCNLPSGRHYFSLAILPNAAALSTYSQFAFSFPTNTQVTWNYNPNNSQVTTTYAVTTQAQEGTQTGFLMALYPHQYTALQSGPINTSFTYPSSRGTMEVLQGTSFTTVNNFPGVLPFLPSTGNFSNTTLKSFVDTVANEANHFGASQSGGGSNTYDIGKDLARVAHLLPIAKVAGDTTALNSLQTSLQNELQLWFNGAANNQTSNVFYYNGNWGTLIGYPAAFGSDIALNDHHFHYGYWIHSSAILGLFNPSWIQANNWGGMVSLLSRDIAAPTRNDGLFPFMRHFDLYAGHSWASGQAPFGDGENQESSSEAVNAWTGMILYAVEAGNTQLRDAAIWMYTQETNSIFDYWFNDGPVATFPSGFTRVEIANVFDGKGDTGTFFSGQIELEHGIEFLPFHGGSLYLGRDPAYVQRNLAEITRIDPNAFAPSSTNWPDLMEEYEALVDPATALNQFNNTSFVFDGESKANEYYWITNLQALGRVDETVTANTPLYRVFKTPSGVRTHVAFNAGSTSITVNFSDGANLTVPAGTMVSEFGSVTIGGGGAQSPSASLSTNSLTFGNQNVGTTSAAQTVTLTNNGPGTLTINSIAVTGDFSQTNNCGASLAANANCTINVSFKPTASGSRAGTLTVTDNASNGPQTASLSGTGTTAQAPAAPSNLSATAVSSSQINLSWTASSTSGVTYNVYRSTASGFAISSATRIATGVTGTTFSNTGLSASTTFFYLVTAVNANGESVPSNQASATTQSGGGIATGPISINAGGGAAGSFVADTGFSGGSPISTSAAIDVGLIPPPVPPQAVYQTGRSGVSTYTIGGFTPGSGHQVQLHFAEIVFTAARQRAFNIIINGTTVLSNFDIVANAGVPNKAIEENFSATANSSGQIVIQFTTGSAGTPLVNGLVVQ